MTEKKQKPQSDSPYTSDKISNGYGCGDYRQEMILAGLQQTLQNADLDEDERRKLQEQIRMLEEAMGL